MTDRELDCLMKCVLLDSMERWEATAAAVPAFTPSARHDREMRSVLADPTGWANRRAQPVWKKALQRVAVVLLVFSLSLGSLMAVSPTVRATLVRWAVEWHESHITYRYSGNAIAEDMPRYEITDLPEGYVEDTSLRIEWPNYVSIKYKNEELQNTILFDYIYMQQASASGFVPGENTMILPVTVNGLDGQLFLEDDWENKRNVITWIDPDSNLQFTLHANLDRTDILDMAESVSLVKTEK